MTAILQTLTTALKMQAEASTAIDTAKEGRVSVLKTSTALIASAFVGANAVDPALISQAYAAANPGRTLGRPQLSELVLFATAGMTNVFQKASDAVEAYLALPGVEGRYYNTLRTFLRYQRDNAMVALDASGVKLALDAKDNDAAATVRKLEAAAKVLADNGVDAKAAINAKIAEIKLAHPKAFEKKAAVKVITTVSPAATPAPVVTAPQNVVTPVATSQVPFDVGMLLEKLTAMGDQIAQQGAQIAAFKTAKKR